TAATDAVKKSKFQPAMDKDGNPVDGGLRIRLKLPARDPDKGLEGGGLVSNPKLVVGGVINGKAIYLAHPQYPSEARANHATGAVSVQVLIDEKGKVIAAGATNGNPYLRYAAAEAACSSKFSPTLLSGQPVKVSGVITYNFMQ
ncbi:MAG: TonB family protein, partial [Acidobacteria bacterium]|nr:TonB family protein [Acidobacteriota bacterium]